MKFIHLIIAALMLVSCIRSQNKATDALATDTVAIEDVQIGEIHGPRTVGEIPLKEGYERIPIDDTTSFAYFLRNLPLKPLGTPVYTYYGDVASTTHSAYAVVDGFAPGNEDLQQCADAIIRLRAEWLYKNKRYDEIAFHFTNGWLCEYRRWAEGERVAVNGNKTSWYKATTADYSYSTFLQYLRMVFNYAGTLSLSKELKPATIHSIQIGNVFIHGGSPGHAIIVVDVAQDTTWHKGDKCFIVAESYMPAQDIHIISNENMYRESLNPWHLAMDVYRSGESYNFTTYFFNAKELKRF